jgi:NAD(P)H-dependent FMN reductase
MSRPILQIVIGSTRPGRVGLPVAEWFDEAAVSHGGFDVEVVDLADVGLPFFDEPRHPRLGEYEHEHTRRWSAIVDRADAFVFVVPEYNHGFNAEIKNALDFLHREWSYKPIGFVSYGGVSAGTRAVQMLKQVVVALKMVPVPESVNIPMVTQFIDAEERLHPNPIMEGAARAMLDELAVWTESLRSARSGSLAGATEQHDAEPQHEHAAA